ncbi:MAG: addiction module protein [Beggiatoa sp.]|nr:addiction module protein [Beggiatoa sp.]
MLEQRLTAYRENPQAGSPWEEVRARLERLT